MGQLEIDCKNDVYQLLNVIKEIPGSNIYYKNTEGVILWHNNHVVQDLKTNKNNIIGQTFFNLFDKEDAIKCQKDDLEVISSRRSICKQQSIKLLNGETHQYIITKTPWMITPDQIGGIIVNAINLRELFCKKFESCYIYNQNDMGLSAQLQKLYFNFKNPLKEILTLTNIMLLGKIDHNVKELCTELRDFVKKLLSNCNRILETNKIKSNSYATLTYQQITLRTFLQSFINQNINQEKYKNLKLIMKISNRIPEVIIGDALRIKKILQIITEYLLKQIKENTKVNLLYKIKMLGKLNNAAIIGLNLEGNSYLFRKIILNENKQHPESNLVLIEKNVDEWQLVKSIVKELEGELEVNYNTETAKITICIPVAILSN